MLICDLSPTSPPPILLKAVQDEADDRGITLVRVARRRKSRSAASPRAGV